MQATFVNLFAVHTRNAMRVSRLPIVHVVGAEVQTRVTKIRRRVWYALSRVGIYLSMDCGTPIATDMEVEMKNVK